MQPTFLAGCKIHCTDTTAVIRMLMNMPPPSWHSHLQAEGVGYPPDQEAQAVARDRRGRQVSETLGR